MSRDKELSHSRQKHEQTRPMVGTGCTRLAGLMGIPLQVATHIVGLLQRITKRAIPTFMVKESKTECLIGGNITPDLTIFFFFMENKTMRNRAGEASQFSV